MGYFPSSMRTLTIFPSTCVITRVALLGGLPTDISRALRATPSFMRFSISSLPTQYRSQGVSPSKP